MPYYSLFHSLGADVVQNGLNDLHELIQCLTSQQDALTVIQVFFFLLFLHLPSAVPFFRLIS